MKRIAIVIAASLSLVGAAHATDYRQCNIEVIQKKDSFNVAIVAATVLEKLGKSDNWKAAFAGQQGAPCLRTGPDMTRNRSLRLLAVLASLSVITPITAAKADKTEDCLTEMNHLASKTTALSMLVTKVLKEADGDIASFLANPTDARLGAFTESLIRAVETVTKRPVYSFARNFVTTEAFEITKAAKAEAADMTAVAGLFDEDEQAVLEQERRGRIQPLLTKAAGLGVRAALTWCNRPGGSTAP